MCYYYLKKTTEKEITKMNKQDFQAYMGTKSLESLTEFATMEI